MAAISLPAPSKPAPQPLVALSLATWMPAGTITLTHSLHDTHMLSPPLHTIHSLPSLHVALARRLHTVCHPRLWPLLATYTPCVTLTCGLHALSPLLTPCTPSIALTRCLHAVHHPCLSPTRHLLPLFTACMPSITLARCLHAVHHPHLLVYIIYY